MTTQKEVDRLFAIEAIERFANGGHADSENPLFTAALLLAEYVRHSPSVPHPVKRLAKAIHDSLGAE